MALRRMSLLFGGDYAAMDTRLSFLGAKALLGTSVITLALVANAPSAFAQTPDAQTVRAPTQRAFNIPPQSLASALPLFGQQSGRQISADSALVRGLATPGVQGTMSVDDALHRLLSGTGLTFSVLGGTTIALQRVGQAPLDPSTLQLDPVQVQGVFPVPSQAMIDNLPPPYAGGQVATGGQLGLLGNRGIMDTPFNQSSYTAKKAQDQQAQTVRDVLIDDPSVRAWVADGGNGPDNTYIRGFSVNGQNTAYGNLFTILPSNSVSAELAERIEVLKGPSAMLNGLPAVDSIGGTINVVPKRAPDEGLTQLTANYTSAGQFGGHLDVGRRFGNDKQFGVRLNGAFRAGETAVESNTYQRSLIAIGLDFRGEHVRLSADIGYQYRYIGGVIPYLGLANGVPLPWAPDARNNIGQTWGFNETKDTFGVIRAEVDMTERVTAYAAFGAHDSRLGWEMGGNTVTINNVNGNGTATSGNLSSYTTYITGETGLRAFVDTGPITHEVAITGTFQERTTGSGNVNGAAYATNIYTPNLIARPSIATPSANKISFTERSSIAIADTLSAADKRVQLTIGARLQRVAATNFNAVTGARTTSYDESALSPGVALIFKPWQNVTLYGNWIQGLQQGAIVGPAFTNAGEVFPPYKSTQFEAGIKVDFGKVTTTASVFQISQPSTLTNVATNTLILGGEQRNRGLEFNFFGEPFEGVRLLGGAMFLEAVLTKTQAGLTDGWIAPFAPSLNLNLGAEWDVPFARGLTLNGRAVYTGSQYIDTTFPRRSLPEWTRFDLGARYTIDDARSPSGKPISIKFNVDNLLDADYWASGGGATSLNLGAPRTFRLSLASNF